MKMSVFLKLIRSKFESVKEEVEKGAFTLAIDDKVKYLIQAEWEKTQEELSKLIESTKNKIEERKEQSGQNDLMITEESCQPFIDFLAKRWERIRLDSPASYLVESHTPANICCREIASWLSDIIPGSSLMQFLIPTLIKPDAFSIDTRTKEKIFPTNTNIYILSDDEGAFVEVPGSLLSPDSKGQFYHTRPGWEKKPLTDNERIRLINFCPETRAYYECTNYEGNESAEERKEKREMRFQLAQTLRERKSLRPKLISKDEEDHISYGYSEEGRKLLISHLFKNRDDLIKAMLSYPASEHAIFLENFDLKDLSRIILGVEPGDQFKQDLQSYLYEESGYQSEEQQTVFLFVLQYLYHNWISQRSDKEKVFEEWDVMTMNKLRKEEKDVKILSSSGKEKENEAEDFFVLFTPLMKDFYRVIQKNEANAIDKKEAIKKQIAKIEKAKKEIKSREDLVQALQTISFVDKVWQSFVNNFFCNELSLIMLKPNVSFASAFSAALDDDSLFRADPDYNRRLLYWFNYLYESWRTTQGNCTTIYLGYQFGYEKQVKVEASKFIGHFLASNAKVEDYDHFLETYIEALKIENETRTGDTKLSDPTQLAGALKTGIVRAIILRMKKVLDPDFKPSVNLGLIAS